MVLEDIKKKYNDCILCGNCDNKMKIFGFGNPTAKIAVISTAPGKEKTEKAHQLLLKILASIDLPTENLYFTHTILCEPNEDRIPTKEEYSNCRKRLFEELSIIEPKFGILVGDTALKSILGENYKSWGSHGNWFTTLAWPCFFYFSLLDPAWILRSSIEGEMRARKLLMWKDIKAFKSEMEVLNNSININSGAYHNEIIG